jgi:hypothetical protein
VEREKWKENKGEGGNITVRWKEDKCVRERRYK